MKFLFNNIFVKILAALLLFAGFGMIHASSQIIERLGSIFIGLGAFYYIILLLMNRNK